MGSSQFSSSSYDLNWTPEQNKLFENALATYDKDVPDRWQKIAKLVGGTNEQEVKKQYEILLHDIKLIESGKVPFPRYRRNGASRRINGISNEEESSSD
ncbi:hypothetical protein PTKIN_Ptkin08bG0184600 [Pterospermum kingtungense]